MNAKREYLEKETVNEQRDRLEKDYEHRLSIIKAHKEGKVIEYKSRHGWQVKPPWHYFLFADKVYRVQPVLTEKYRRYIYRSGDEYIVGVCCSAVSSENYSFIESYNFFVRWLDDECRQEEV